MKTETTQLIRICAVIFCTLLPNCALADDDIVVRGGSRNVKQKLIMAPQAGSMDDLNRGLGKYDKGDFKGALVDINKAILKDPLNSQAFFYRGLVRENLGDYVNAVSDFDQNRVAAFDPIVLSEKAECQTNMYELNAALANLNRALAQDHSSSDAVTAFSRRAIVKRLMHNSPDAISDCNQALRLVPNDVEAKWQRGVTYCGMRKYPEAILDLQFVVKPNRASPTGTTPWLSVFVFRGAAPRRWTSTKRHSLCITSKTMRMENKLLKQKLRNCPSLIDKS